MTARMPVPNYRPEYGTYLGYQRCWTQGIVEKIDFAFNGRRKEKLLHSAETIKGKYEKGWSMHKEKRLGQKS